MIHNQTQRTQKNPDVTYGNGFFHFVWEDNYSGAVQYRKGRYSPLTIREKEEKNLKIFPNPIQKGKSLSISATFQIDRVLVYSPTGKLLKETNDQNNSALNVTKLDFSPGMYSIAIIGQKGELHHRLILIQK